MLYDEEIRDIVKKDVLAGAVIGALAGKTIVKQHKTRSSELTITPELSSEIGYIGLRLGYRF